jgi:hypothetical protein
MRKILADAAQVAGFLALSVLSAVAGLMLMNLH